MHFEDRRGDGGVNRGLDRRLDHLRHVQSSEQAHAHWRNTSGRKNWRKARLHIRRKIISVKSFALFRCLNKLFVIFSNTLLNKN